MQVTTGYINGAYHGGGSPYGNTGGLYDNRGLTPSTSRTAGTAPSSYPEDTVTISAAGLALYAAQAKNQMAPSQITQNQIQGQVDTTELALTPSTVEERTLRTVAINANDRYSVDEQSLAALELHRRENDQKTDSTLLSGNITI